MDFTLNKYAELLEALKQSRVSFSLRHDVDLSPANSLRTAQIEAEYGLKAVYYFRIVPESFDEQIIKQIIALGHEIGYHYESLTVCKGDIDEAYKDFCNNLSFFRELVPIKSICMHGSPRSQWDSKDIWKKYSYRELGIEYEPYFDTDFSKTLYLTDTGRRWDGFRVSVRDKIPGFQEDWERKGLAFHSTDEIIAQLENDDSLLLKSGLSLLITTHPQRWNKFGVKYIKELCMQNVKNVIKAYLVSMK